MSIEIGTRVIIAIGGAGQFIECSVAECIDEGGKIFILKPVASKFRPHVGENLDKKKPKKQPPLQMRLHPTQQVQTPDDMRRFGQWCLSSPQKKKKAKKIGGLANV